MAGLTMAGDAWRRFMVGVGMAKLLWVALAALSLAGCGTAGSVAGLAASAAGTAVSVTADAVETVIP